jgi:hypothetical protein
MPPRRVGVSHFIRSRFFLRSLIREEQLKRPVASQGWIVHRTVPKHGQSTLEFVFGSFVLNYIPVLDENAVLHTENARANPVHRQTHA